MAMKLLMPVEIVAARAETPRIREITLRPLRRPAFPAFGGGAHTLLELPDGKRRPYSLISDPEAPALWRIAVQREAESRGGSAWLHDAARVGDRLHATWPQPGLALKPEATRHVLVAGGIGITPFLSMLPALLRGGVPFALHYCVRGPGEAAFLPWLRERLGAALHLHATPAGRLDLAALLRGAAPGTAAYCCGPARMLEGFAAATALWPEGWARMEHFTGLDPVAARQGEPFSVEIASTGAVLEVPAERSLLEVLRAAGHAVEASCEAGACASCVVEVLAGEPVHRDLCLSAEARAARMASCVSRGKGRLRIGL